MSTIASTSPKTGNSFLRLSVIGGLITGMLHLIIQVGIVYAYLSAIFSQPPSISVGVGEA